MTNKEALENIQSRINSLSLFPKVDRKTYDESWEKIEKDLDLLEQYKNVEEELGIDLITFFKALTKGVWVKNESGQIYHTNVYLQNLILSSSPSEIKLGRFCFMAPDNVLLLFDRIKQDWALTKEELENGK